MGATEPPEYTLSTSVIPQLSTFNGSITDALNIIPGHPVRSIEVWIASAYEEALSRRILAGLKQSAETIQRVSLRFTPWGGNSLSTLAELWPDLPELLVQTHFAFSQVRSLHLI